MASSLKIAYNTWKILELFRAKRIPVTDSTSDRTCIAKMILWPAVITLAITILRLVGELRHWGSPWFSASPGGGGAIIGISWLPILLGPYFALKLSRAGEGPAGYGKAFGTTFGGLVVLVLGGALLGMTESHPGFLTLVGFGIMLVAAFIPPIGWRSLGRVLLAYALAARVPVVVVMYLAISGNWGTHYDALPPRFQDMAFWKKFLDVAILPQMTLWIGYTVVVGSLFGGIVTVLLGRKPAGQAST